MARVVAAGNVNSAPEWMDCCWPKCMRMAEGGGPPLCHKHYVYVGEMYTTDTIRTTRAFLDATKPEVTLDEHLATRQVAMAAQSRVYYVRIGDHVKIGYTINLRQRLGALRVDDDALLATEPGGRSVEAQRHKQFIEERVGKRENFNPSRRLLAHIEAVRAEHGPPMITNYPKAKRSHNTRRVV